MADFTWDVHLPGEDLPKLLQTDYLLSEGDEIAVNGRPWIVESVEVVGEESGTTSGVVVVAPAHEVELAPPGS